ncbi:HAD family hydrolase [Agathobaculum sp. Marseille-P7918]|uniref:HAD family hydrolase n=1 Tax=Agathobaculum sp. Marseille-P7918 TaxID=2479843 RepID=UPI003565BF4A
MQKKYFFFDIDGTLSVGQTMVMPESAVRCLEQLRANGHFTALATGRLQASAARFAAQHSFTDFVADGGYSLTLGGKIVEMKSLPAADCIALIDRLETAGIPWAVTPVNERICVTTDKRYLDAAPPEYFPTRYDPAFDYRTLQVLYKVNIACTAEQECNIDFGSLPTVRYNRDILLVEPTEKQNGIRRMVERLGIPNEDVVIFGDGTNDVCMFGQGWFSIAMGNARDALKRMADYVTDPVDQDGLWNACRHFGWI